MRPFCVFIFSLLFVTAPAAQQSKVQDSTQNMPGMDMSDSQMPGMPEAHPTSNNEMNMQPETFVQEIIAHDTSGTSAEPGSTPAPMLMTTKGAWTLMFHANAFVLDEQQSGARGGDKFFSTN